TDTLPAALAQAVDLWRPTIEARAGADLEKLSGALRDQKAFARLARTLLNHLALGDQSDGESGENDEAEGQNPEGQDEDGEDQDSQQDGESATTEAAADS